MQVKKKSQKQEKSVAKDLNAKTVVASGALWSAKGDCRSEKCLIECKTTDKTYYSVTAKVWEKIEEEATRDSMRTPLLVVDIAGSGRFVVFKLSHFPEEKFPDPFVLADNDGKKSFRLKLNGLKESAEDFGQYVYGLMFLIVGKKRNLLCYMRIDDFIEAFKEEI